MFSVVIPLYNEEENINPLINEIVYHLDTYKNYEIILVNDASTDNTENNIKKLNIKNLKILKNHTNSGQSFSIHRGVLNSFYDTIVTIDGDGQNNPSDIPVLLDQFFNNDEVKLIGGIRIKRQDNFIKIYSSIIANSIRSRILNDDCKDTGCSLKVFDKNIFLEFPYFDGIHRFLPSLFKGFGYKTIFLPVQHRGRKFGQSKYGTFNRLFKGIRDIIKVYKIINKKT
tara:strand:- start:1017 stop:1697 length:681 start_codon:yes stop_codon:yes gene_type:complete